MVPWHLLSFPHQDTTLGRQQFQFLCIIIFVTIGNLIQKYGKKLNIQPEKVQVDYPQQGDVRFSMYLFSLESIVSGDCCCIAASQPDDLLPCPVTVFSSLVFKHIRHVFVLVIIWIRLEFRMPRKKQTARRHSGGRAPSKCRFDRSYYYHITCIKEYSWVQSIHVLTG